MNAHAQKKASQLGINPSTAQARLKKMMLFKLVKELGLQGCYRCQNPIETVEDLSIDHKIPWLDSEDPTKLFFDLDNVAFSHNDCNSLSSRKNKIISPDGHSWCQVCRCHLPLECFGNGRRHNGKYQKCRKCASNDNKKYYVYPRKNNEL